MLISSADFASLMVPVLWGLSGLFVTNVVRRWGSLTFNTVRIVPSFLAVACLAWLQGSFDLADDSFIMPLLLSGFIGIALGDLFLFSGHKLLGPRRTAILFSTHSLMTLFIAWAILGEVIPLQAIFGSLILTCGIIVAVAYSKSNRPVHAWEEMPPRVWFAVLLVLFAALSQSVGFVLSRPALADGFDPMAALTLRLGAAGVGLLAARFLPLDFVKASKLKIPWRDIGIITLSGFGAIALANYLILYALKFSASGVVAALTTMAPLVQLPLLRLYTGSWPAPFAWAGALIAVIGATLIVLR